MKLIIVKIDQKIFEGDLKKVVVPAFNGEMEILPGHAPFLSPLKKGVIKFENEKKENQEIQIDSGFVEINKEEVVIVL